MNKKEMVDHLNRIALYLEIRGDNSFKIAAYRRAGQALEMDERPLTAIQDFGQLKGIGKGTAQVINEFIATGESSVLNDLQQELPESLLILLRIPGLGGKKIGKLYQTLAVRDLQTLREACTEGRVRALPGFGEKTEWKILQAIEKLDQRPKELPISYMIGLAENIEEILRQMTVIDRFSRAGSLRRAKEQMKDLDFVVETEDPETAGEEILKQLGYSEIVGRGEAKMTLLLNDPYHVSVDFRFAGSEAYVTTLHHFTGSKDHNVLLRHLAKQHGEKISEYGIETEEGQCLTFRDESQFYDHLGLHFIPAPVREGTHEVELAQKGPLGLISLADIQADLHLHSTWSDGTQTIAEMAQAAKDRGYQYACLTDHSQSLRVANGLSVERLQRQQEEIAQFNEQTGDFKLFSGTEIDILPDGSLDYPDTVLEQLDFVIASIHSSFTQSQADIMKRLENACHNPYVRLIAHPTGRLLGRRKGYEVDIAQLIQMAKETGTALEINASRNRLDLSAEWAGQAQDAGVKLAIDTDSHSRSGLSEMELGVRTAQRGWIRPATVLNTMTLARFTAFLQQKKQG
ncbi:MAG: DNA polymerase/3'-5' exonuclease PolX [Sporolactobacillus sp.]